MFDLIFFGQELQDFQDYFYSPKAIEIFGFHLESQKNIQ